MVTTAQPSIAIDAMSGDHGIEVTVPAALAVLAKHEDVCLLSLIHI